MYRFIKISYEVLNKLLHIYTSAYFYMYMYAYAYIVCIWVCIDINDIKSLNCRPDSKLTKVPASSSLNLILTMFT